MATRCPPRRMLESYTVAEGVGRDQFASVGRTGGCMDGWREGHDYAVAVVTAVIKIVTMEDTT